MSTAGSSASAARRATARFAKACAPTIAVTIRYSQRLPPTRASIPAKAGSTRSATSHASPSPFPSRCSRRTFPPAQFSFSVVTASALSRPPLTTQRAITVENLATGAALQIRAPYFLDATENSDVIPLAGVEHVTGSESRAQTGEPSAPELAHPENVQAFSVCFALEEIAGENHPIPRPARYDFWRNYVPRLSPPWPWLSLTSRTC